MLKEYHLRKLIFKGQSHNKINWQENGSVVNNRRVINGY